MYYVMGGKKQFSLYPCSPVSSLTTASCQPLWSPVWIICVNWSSRQVITLHVSATTVISWCTGATALLESSTCFCRPTRYKQKNQNHRELIRPAHLVYTPCRSSVLVHVQFVLILFDQTTLQCLTNAGIIICCTACLLLSILTRKVFGEQQYLHDAMQCGEVIWHRGLLKKGYGLCHGAAGNAYAFLALYKLTQEPRHLYRACMVTHFSGDQHNTVFVLNI